MKKLGKSSKKGFTLVELIVVLVILAVLAAMLVPALIGYIDRARAEKEYQTAATVYGAAQAVITEKYAKDDWTEDTDEEDGILATGAILTSMPDKDDAVLALAGVSGAVSDYKFTFTDNIIDEGWVKIGDYTYHLEISEDGVPSWSAAEGDIPTE
jgi:type IV pilus assembly protein PilA